MANQLTNGLLAGAAMAMTNLIIGIEPISWNVFLAGMTAMLLNLDSGDSRVSGGTPLGHSLGSAAIIVYVAGIAASCAISFMGIDIASAVLVVFAIGTGAVSHLISELATGGRIFTVPGNLKLNTWFVRCNSGSKKFWDAWGRFSLRGKALGDVHLNTMSIVMVLVSIGIQ
ncbi:MAG: hypothetical protein Q7J68_04350 [Thermoplasmata archaeon]|nr:hypothetical protein [Thermoplasmata archaeon]